MALSAEASRRPEGDGMKRLALAVLCFGGTTALLLGCASKGTTADAGAMEATQPAPFRMGAAATGVAGSICDGDCAEPPMTPSPDAADANAERTASGVGVPTGTWSAARASSKTHSATFPMTSLKVRPRPCGTLRNHATPSV